MTVDNPARLLTVKDAMRRRGKDGGTAKSMGCERGELG